MYNHNKAQQSKNRVHISWDILYGVTVNTELRLVIIFNILIWNMYLHHHREL